MRQKFPGLFLDYAVTKSNAQAKGKEQPFPKVEGDYFTLAEIFCGHSDYQAIGDQGANSLLGTNDIQNDEPTSDKKR